MTRTADTIGGFTDARPPIVASARAAMLVFAQAGSTVRSSLVNLAIRHPDRTANARGWGAEHGLRVILRGPKMAFRAPDGEGPERLALDPLGTTHEIRPTSSDLAPLA